MPTQMKKTQQNKTVVILSLLNKADIFFLDCVRNLLYSLFITLKYNRLSAALSLNRSLVLNTYSIYDSSSLTTEFKIALKFKYANYNTLPPSS